MKIIFGTDFSANAGRAGTVAATLAGRLGDTLQVVHAHEAAGLGAATPEVLDSLFAITRTRLGDEAQRLRALGADVKGELFAGLADEAMAKVAASGGVRMVVVGSLGHRAPERWLIGSVSERIAEGSPVPTLVVRQPEALLDWAGTGRPLRVLCGYDFTPTADAAVRQALELRRLGPVELTVAWINWPWEERNRLGVAAAYLSGANPPEMQAILERELRQRMAELLGEEPANLRVLPGLGRPDFDLLELARAERANLIVTGTHQWRGVERLWHTSVSRGILHHAPMNVLVVPPAAGAEPARLPEIRRVLVATDFSAPGNAAIAHGCAVVQPGGTVRLLHVAAPPHPVNPLIAGQYEAPAPTRQEHERELRTDEARLRELVPVAAFSRGVACEVEVVAHAEAAVAICQAAERFDADVICLASHGRTGLISAVLGSVAQAVMARSARPVLVVRRPHPAD